jgi:hypothetical protein
MKQDLSVVVMGFRAAPVDRPPLDRLGRSHLSNAVERVLSKLPTDSRCLVRSLVLLWLLERRGTTGTLVIGVSPKPEFEAHAWVEHEGRPLLPSGEGQYARMVEI